jgi:glycerol-3-phosphate dehydrogenase
MSKPHAIVVGAGFTGVATAHDLALRGFQVTVVERGPIANGTSGRTHGLLHSGGRYVVYDQESAIECIAENIILRRIAAQVIEPNGGLFVALTDADLAYGVEFEEGCEQCHISTTALTPKQALQLEPALNPRLLKAYCVPDGTFDPLRLALAFAATARSNGAQFHLFTEVIGMLLDGKGDVVGVKIWDRAEGRTDDLRGDIVVNCAGAWAGEIAALADVQVPIRPTPGVMVAYDRRLCERTINRLCPPADGDIVLPQRRMMVVGTTSYEVTDLDYIPVIDDQIHKMYEEAVRLIPAIAATRQRGAYTSTRPLIDTGLAGRDLARTLKCFDCKKTHDVEGLVTITGGKATTCRLMAEKITDLVCQKLSIDTLCYTKEVPLLSYRRFQSG